MRREWPVNNRRETEMRPTSSGMNRVAKGMGYLQDARELGIGSDVEQENREARQRRSLWAKQ